ncbi:hypothetical protein FAI41_07900 [Acetobacteraceae bacterium]|nr:hypothetical protein FAI41_07900 [Acetobacteraceae bacterium]
MKKKIMSQKLKKLFWWLGCFLAAFFSIQGILVSLFILCFSLRPVDMTGLAKRFVGTFYLNDVGDFSAQKKHAVGKEVWDNLKIQWVLPHFRDWFFNQDIGEIAFSLSGVKLVDLEEKEIDHLDKIAGKIAITPFSKGKIAVTSLEADGLALGLKKLKEGEIILDFPGVHRNPNPSKMIDLSFLDRDFFQSLKMQNLFLALMVEKDGKRAEIKIPDLNLQNFSENNAIGRWEGHFGIFAKDGGKTAIISGKREAGENQDLQDWQMDIDIPAPQDFANILPLMDQIHLPFKSQISGEPILCALGLKNCHLALQFQVGQGYYKQPDGTKMQVAEASGAGKVAWKKNYRKLQAEIDPLDVVWIDSFGKPTKESLRATLGLDNLLLPQKTILSIHGNLPDFNLASLPTLWPLGLANGARAWIIENLTRGQAHHFTLNIDLSGNEGFDHLKVQEMSGNLEAENVTVHWLDGMPPFKGVGVSAKFLDADNVLVKMSGGSINETPGSPVNLSKGSVAIRGVTVHEHQIAGKIDLNLSGSAPKLVEMLSRDCLPILKRFKKYYRTPKGTFEGQIMLDLPFAPWVKADDILFETQVTTHDLAANLRGIGQVKHFDGVLNARNKDLTVKANALVRNIPVKMDLYNDLTANKPGQEMLKIYLHTAVNQDFLHKIGIPISAEQVTGRGELAVEIAQPYADKDHNETNMMLHLDMKNAAVKSLLWHKAKHIPAGGSLHASWQDGDLASITDVAAYGPEIEIQANSLLRNHQIEGVDVSHFKIGKNEGKFRFEWPFIKEEGATLSSSSQKKSQKYFLKLRASKIDLELFLKKTSTEVQDTLKGQKIPEMAKPVMKQQNGRILLPKGNWDIDLRVEKAFLGQGRILGPWSILANWNKGHLKRADIEIEKPYHAFLKVSHNLKNQEEHFFEGGTDHLGEWLAWGKIYDALKGGKVSISGKFAPAIELASVSDPLLIDVGKHRKNDKKSRHGKKDVVADPLPFKREEKPNTAMIHTEGLGLGLPPYAGKISLEGMDWHSSLTAVLLAKILSPTHWKHVNGNLTGISLNGAISVQDGIIGFGNVQGKSDILTATMVGNINLKKDKIDLGGTVSPYYYWNSSPGHLPSILGYIFSPQKGSGILAMGYTLDGELPQPHFNLNPYMMLLPGILRKIANPNI